MEIQAVTGVDPVVLECPGVATCYLTGNHYVTGNQGETQVDPSEGMLVTHNGGKTWLARGPFVSTTLTCVNTQVCAGSTGTAGHATFAETVDGGQHWSSLPMPGQYANALSCTTARYCVSVESFSGQVDITTDGARTWTKAHLPGGLRGSGPASGFQPFGLPCFTTGRCVAIGNILAVGNVLVGPTIALYSADGGLQWHKGAIPTHFAIGANLSCGTPMDCMAIGSDGRSPAIATRDGGRTWQSVTNPAGTISSKGFSWVACVGESECWMLADQDHGSSLGVVETTDLGQSWQLLKAPPSVGPGSTLACATTTTCYATANTVQAPPAPTSVTTIAPEASGGSSLFLSW